MDSLSPIIGQIDKGVYQKKDKLWIDKRYNLYEILTQLDGATRSTIEQQARSVACLVQEDLLIKLPGSTQYHISPRVPSLAQKLKAGYEESLKVDPGTKIIYTGPFQNEFSLAEGTAFLVGKQLVLTAAHCICDKFSGDVLKAKVVGLRILFGYQMQSPGNVYAKFESKDVYRIDAVWRHCYKSNESDWALLKLDREVEGRDPLSIAASQTIPLNTTVYMLGYPSGLPLKLTISGHVEKDHPRFFEAALDAFGGNSGSPVFVNDTGSVMGMLFRGNDERGRFCITA